MKKARIILGILCLICLAAGGYYIYRNRKNIDTEGPKFQTKAKQIEVGIDASEEELAEDIRAVDARDGDVSDSILIETIRKKKDGEANEFEVTFVAFDSSNNSSKMTKTLVYTDYRKPHFSISQELRFPENQDLSLLDYVRADDCIDGDISPFITVEGADELLDEPTKGIYDCTVRVINSVGDSAELPLQVEIYEDSYDVRTFRPSVVLTDYMIYHKKGEELDLTQFMDHVEDQGYCRIDSGPMVTTTNQKGEEETVTEQIANGSEEKWVNISQIDVRSDVDINQEGIYSVIYSYTSEESGYEGNTKLIVIVE